MNETYIKKLGAFIVFALSLLVYLLTIEPTISFWDCSEFITCAYNLEVGHAPGAPIFMLFGRIASFFAGQDTERVALMINGLSSVMSALTVMFLFLTIIWFIKKIIASSKLEIVSGNLKYNLLVYGSAFIGAFSYAVSDSFWFSAVEGEVYATSSMFSALVFWCMLKYEEAQDGWDESKWIILIFFLLGFSIGIHLLNLLAFPSMALIFYLKKNRYSLKGVIKALVLASLIMLALVFMIIPGIAKLAALTDLLFVNSLHLPVYSGALFSILGITVLLVFFYHKKIMRRDYLKKIVVLCSAFWLLGYSSFVILVIRSNHNTFIDINNVENVFGLVDYLNREQYASRPLVYGNNYNSPIIDSEKRFTYKLYDENYHKDELNPKYIFDDKTMTLFPRMASLEERHVKAYNNWIDIKGRKVQITKPDGSSGMIKVPTLADNLKFFFKYQLNHMYWRYFMWNFAGKQNDIQSYGGKMDGNWISGITFYDNWRLGNQDNLPEFYKNHPARNTYYMLPLVLGFVGLIYQARKDKNNFLVASILFVLTGIAIVVYLNEIPITPRERDYVHVGSYYVFAIWMGVGVFAILQQLLKYSKKSILVVSGLAIITACVPVNMLKENWDDHNRSSRFTARDYAKNMLKSCDENAILFTTADNDTYPIWYLQEVEKFRTDIRQVLLTFLPIDWYGNQLSNNYENRGALPVSFKGTELLMNKNQYFPVLNKVDSFVDVGQVVEFVKNSDARTKVKTNSGSSLNFIPTQKLSLKVNKNNFIKSCKNYVLNPKDIPNKIDFKIAKQYLGRDDMLLLDLLNNNNWERPIYFMYPHLLEELGLSDYVHREGMVYRFMPFKVNQNKDFDKKQAKHQYDLLKNQFAWGNVNSSEVFLDHTNIQIITSFRFRQMFADVARQLINNQENAKAIEILNLCSNTFPINRVPTDYFNLSLLQEYYNSGYIEKANEFAQLIFDNYMETISSYAEREITEEIRLQHYMLQETLKIVQQKSPDLYESFVKQYQDTISG